MPRESRNVCHISSLSFVAALSLAAAAYSQAPPPSTPGGDVAFQKSVVPVLANTCSPCHNSQLASGGLNVANFLKTEFPEGESRRLGSHRPQDPPQ
jgi:hypothetical protein